MLPQCFVARPLDHVAFLGHLPADRSVLVRDITWSAGLPRRHQEAPSASDICPEVPLGPWRSRRQ